MNALKLTLFLAIFSITSDFAMEQKIHPNELINAILARNIKRLQDLIPEVDVNEVADVMGPQIPLIFATKNNAPVEYVALLLKAGADVRINKISMEQLHSYGQ